MAGEAVLPGALCSPTSSNCCCSGFLWSQPLTTLFSDRPPLPDQHPPALAARPQSRLPGDSEPGPPAYENEYPHPQWATSKVQDRSDFQCC